MAIEHSNAPEIQESPGIKALSDALGVFFKVLRWVMVFTLIAFLFSGVFVVEQNRDGQLRTLLVNECGVAPAHLTPILHYDGTPITARFIASEIVQNLLGNTKPAARAAAMGN